MSAEPRFYVRESHGYLIQVGGSTHGSTRAAVEVLVLDRGYCHRVVWSSLTTELRHTWQRYGKGAQGQQVRKGFNVKWATARAWPLARRRRYAADLAARLNAEAA